MRIRTSIRAEIRIIMNKLGFFSAKEKEKYDRNAVFIR